MKAVAYCRVSTNKEEQLDSLDSQEKFFKEYCRRNPYDLIQIYADEGKSGTKMKNRTQLLKLLADAGLGIFDIVLIKDVSRLARNTLDFLKSIRQLKALGVKVIFVNYDQTSSDSSEFLLTLLSAIAQEESANTSKRVKFGKRQNAEKGRVPNIVFGYDKIPGDYFHLTVNGKESAVVHRIFDMYVHQDKGENRIASVLNAEGVRTKRNCLWTQNAVSRILSNELYTGAIINGKQEVVDFLTGKRRENGEEKWLKTYRPELRIIDDETFRSVQQIQSARKEAFKLTGNRSSEKHLFSKLIRCKCCGASFRRQVRKYKNTYVKWVCTGRNVNGVSACPNKTVIDEQELLDEIRYYFSCLLKDKPSVIKRLVSQFRRQYKTREDHAATEKTLSVQLEKLNRSRRKSHELFENGVISLAEVKERTKQLDEQIKKLGEELNIVRRHISKSDILKSILNDTFRGMEELLATDITTNATLSHVIDRIEVDQSGHVEIFLKLFKTVGPGNDVQLLYNRTQRRIGTAQKAQSPAVCRGQTYSGHQ